MNRTGPLVIVLVSALAAGIIVASGLVRDPGFFVPISVEAGLLIGVTAIFIRFARDPDDRAFLWRVAMLALVARGIAMLIVYGVLDPIVFASDHYTYYARGQEVAAFLQQGIEGRFVGKLQVGWEWVNGIFRVLLVDADAAGGNLGPPILNLFAGVWTCLTAWALGREVFDDKVGRIAAVLCAVFPSLVLWSILNIRDGFATLLITTIVLVAVRSYRRIHLPDLVVFLAMALALTTLRDYMGILLIAGLGLGYGLSARPGRIGSTLVMGTVMSLGLFFLLERFEILTPEIVEDPFASAASFRTSLQQDFAGGLAGSAYATGIDTSTLQGALTYLPLGLLYFLFAPFPWAIESPLQALTLPETLLWYALVPFTIVGLRRGIRREHAAGLLIMGVLAISVSSYALVEGTFGTAYRHRSQFLPLFFVFAAQGIRWWVVRRRTIRDARMHRRADARAAMLRPDRG